MDWDGCSALVSDFLFSSVPIPFIDGSVVRTMPVRAGYDFLAKPDFIREFQYRQGGGCLVDLRVAPDPDTARVFLNVTQTHPIGGGETDWQSIWQYLTPEEAEDLAGHLLKVAALIRAANHLDAAGNNPR